MILIVESFIDPQHREIPLATEIVYHKEILVFPINGFAALSEDGTKNA